jgi:hypothetical protein
MTNIPSSLTKQHAKLWKAVMANFYGRYNRSRKCWIGKFRVEGDTVLVCMRPNKLEVTSNGKYRFFHFSIAGHFLFKDGTKPDCHPCQGAMGLITLSDAQKKLAVVAKNSLYEKIGPWGSAPPEENFSIQKLGPRGNFGWLIKGSYTGQGINPSWVDVHGHFADTIRKIGSIPLGYSMWCEGGKSSDGVPCPDYSFEMAFDTTERTTAFYSIILKGSGLREGKRFNPIFRIPFNRKSLSYTLPGGLPAELQD